MIDIKELRENPKIYEKNMEKRGKDPKIVNSLIQVDEKWRRIKKRADDLRAERNSVSEAINQAKKQKNEQKAKQLIFRAQEIPEKLKALETEEAEAHVEMDFFLKEIPNLMHPSVPLGVTDKQNKVKKVVGSKTKLKFKAKNHVELIESLDLGDFDSSALVAGAGFYYLKNDLALLNRALINFATDLSPEVGVTFTTQEFVCGVNPNLTQDFSKLCKDILDQTFIPGYKPVATPTP